MTTKTNEQLVRDILQKAESLYKMGEQSRDRADQLMDAATELTSIGTTLAEALGIDWMTIDEF